MSQEQLAQELDCSRAMVARMENENHGLNDIVTRRNVAKALGIAPVMLGLIGPEEVHSQVLYDPALLRKTLLLHREVYFSGGNVGGIGEVNETVKLIADISKSLQHKNRDLLEILCHYGQLGIDISREEQNYKAVDRYASWSVEIAKKLNDPDLTAAALLRWSAAMYEKGDLGHSRLYADEALSYKHVSPSVEGGVLLEACKVYATQNEPTAMKLVERANTIAKQPPSDEDTGFVKLTAGFCHLRKAHTLIEMQEYNNALDVLDLAEITTSPHLVRRKCSIQIMQARALTRQGEYDGAVLSATSALTLANAIHSAPNLSYLVAIHQELQKSSYGTSKEVNLLGKSLANVFQQRPLLRPVL